MECHEIGGQRFTALFPDLLRPLTPAERERLRASIREIGVKVPVLLDEHGGIIDGVNRVTLTVEEEIGTLPSICLPGLTHEQKRAIAISCNVDRRQLSPDEQTAARAERIETVVEMRVSGDSLRTIAEAVGVTQTQVARDLETATVTGVTVELPDGKVTGKDGRTTTPPATVPGGTVKLLCRACRLGTPKKSCKECKALNTPKVEKPTDVPREAGVEDESDKDIPKIDDDFQPIPTRAIPAFCAALDIEELCREIDRFKKVLVANRATPGWEMVMVDSVTQTLANARMTLRHSRATHVCPYCQGKENTRKADKICNCCKGRGWTTKDHWKTCPDIIEREMKAKK